MSNNLTAARYRILRWPDVHQLIGLSRSQVHKLVARGQFPQPIKLGMRASGWLEADLLAWVEVRLKDRETACAEGSDHA